MREMKQLKGVMRCRVQGYLDRADRDGGVDIRARLMRDRVSTTRIRCDELAGVITSGSRVLTRYTFGKGNLCH